jgi:O-antigen ligase
VAVLVLLALLLYRVWRHLKQWRRPIIFVGLSALSLGALVAIIKMPELQQLLVNLLRGVSLEGALPLVFAVMCLITYGVLGLARTTSP